MDNILSTSVLGRLSQITTTEKYVFFDSSSFSNGDYMYFSISARENCLDTLKYKYFDNEIIVTNDILTSSTFHQISKTTKNQRNGSDKYSAYFSIQKKANDLDGSNGNYLLLVFDNCSGTVEIENIKDLGIIKTLANIIVIIIVVVVVVVVIIIVLIIIIVCVYAAKKRRAAMINYNMPVIRNYAGSPYGATPLYVNQGVIQPYPNGIPSYAYQNQNMVMMNNNNMNFSQNHQPVQIVQNDIVQQSVSNREINYQFEKPK